MRIAATLLTSPQSTMAKIASPPLNIHQRSAWHSPIPYLFGGLAAMLGLIAFALLILACSYWKLSGNQVSNDGESEQSNLENGDADDHGQSKTTTYEEKIVVIMAGDCNPTFLATPMANSNKSSSKM